MKKKTMFSSNSVTEHILRGGVGVTFLWLAIDLAYTHPFTSLGLGVVVLVVFRGCPICWTIGLFETLYIKYARIKSPNKK